MLGTNGSSMLEQVRLLFLEPLRELVHRLLVALLIEARERGDGLLDFFWRYDVRGHDRGILSQLVNATIARETRSRERTRIDDGDGRPDISGWEVGHRSVGRRRRGRPGCGTGRYSTGTAASGSITLTEAQPTYVHAGSSSLCQRASAAYRPRRLPIPSPSTSALRGRRDPVSRSRRRLVHWPADRRSTCRCDRARPSASGSLA